jgi:hypothetical protein|nr:MAG TPA: hypothetical protein [Caudoviricetes sp.]
MNNLIREIIKSNLQKLSKDELVDALADIYMACPPFSIANMLSNVQEIKSPIKEAINQQANMQHINAQFAEIKQPLKYIRKMKKVRKFLWRYVGVLYFPIYLLAWVLHKIARLVLAIAYFGLLNKQAGKDIIKSLFKWHGRY